MAGTKAGGRQAAITNKETYGEDFYKDIGRIGGSKSRGGGFTGNRQMASIWGKVGGSISRRGNVKPNRSELQRLRQEARERLERLSLIQRESLSAKYGNRRPW